MARKMRFSSGSRGRSEVPRTPRLRASVREPGFERTVARTLRYISRASPRQSRPAPMLAVEAGTRTSNEGCRAEVIGSWQKRAQAREVFLTANYLRCRLALTPREL